MLWPYLAATLVRGSAVTAWTHLATAPIQGRAPANLPPIGAPVGADGVILEIVNDRLDPAPVRLAEAALANARTRLAAATDYLELGAGARPPAARLDEAQRRRLPRRSRRRDRLARGARGLAGGQGGARRGDRRAQPQRFRRRLPLARLSRRGQDPPGRGRGRSSPPSAWRCSRPSGGRRRPRTACSGRRTAAACNGPTATGRNRRPRSRVPACSCNRRARPRARPPRRSTRHARPFA